jgi:hypothetical protein
MRRLTSSTLLLVLCLCPMLRSDTTLNTEGVKKIVVFIYESKVDASKPDGTAADETKPMGTGFFVTVPVTIPGTTQKGSVLAVVTARHMVDPYWMTCSPEPQTQPDRRFYIRLNNKQYDPNSDKIGVSYLPIDLVKNGKKRYFVRDDDDKVDAAVVDVAWQDWNKMQEKYDFAPMRLSVFASLEEISKLKIGDSIASAGLVPGRSGEKRNYPFFKFGEVSNIPDEPTQVGCRTVRVWFVAANLISGNSGSPIFYAPAVFPSTISPVTRGVLIGIQSSTIIAHSDQGGSDVLEPADISGMTPVDDLFKIFEKNLPPDTDLYRGDEAKRNIGGEVKPH